MAWCCCLCVLLCSNITIHPHSHPVPSHLSQQWVVPGGEPHQVLQYQHQKGALGATRGLIKTKAVLVPRPPGGAVAAVRV